MALVLSRKSGERLVIGEDIVILVNRIQGDRVSIAVEAPKEVRVRRDELLSDEERTRILPFPRRDERGGGMRRGA